MTVSGSSCHRRGRGYRSTPPPATPPRPAPAQSTTTRTPRRSTPPTAPARSRCGKCDDARRPDAASACPSPPPRGAAHASSTDSDCPSVPPSSSGFAAHRNSSPGQRWLGEAYNESAVGQVESLFTEAQKQLSSAAGSSLLEQLQPNDRVVPGLSMPSMFLICFPRFRGAFIETEPITDVGALLGWDATCRLS